MRNFITKILLLIKVSYHIISAINIVIGGFGKHRNTSTSFVAPLLIALSMTLNVTLSATKRSRCYSLRGNRLRLGARSRSFGVE